MTRALVRHSSYLVQPLPDCTPLGITGMHLVVKRSYRIVPDGQCEPLTLQPPLALADVFAEPGDPLGSPLLTAGELAPPKPRVDVLLTGHCHPPGGEATTCEVKLRIGVWRKSVLVVGDRTAWLPAGARRAQVSRPRPFNAIPLCWTRAYGGCAPYGEMRIAHPFNPIGTGFVLDSIPGAEPGEAQVALPNIEDPRSPIPVDALRVNPGDLDSVRRPVGTASIPRHWMPRARQGGLDPRVREWMIETTGVEPTLQTADPRVHNAAPDDQQLAVVEPGARVELDHVHPERSSLRFRLPEAQPQIRWGCNRQPLASVPVRLDTVAIDSDRLTLSLIWRGTVPFGDGPRLADDIERMRFEADGEPILPASLVDSGFPLRLMMD